ncbi:hypothetical protein QYE76_052402 [Lolium multiflorum]|uniref:CCHC-type domain-containing protein n=1 Tax=Lolium multiflorum TaxID=4521 RepID=A0AAD8STN6_LOLMU|nr:hypothetical protein QYE76_052402 [Lolium multiflorum]
MAESSNANTTVSGLKASTEENSSEDTQSSRRDSSSGNSGKTTTQSQPDLPPSASKKSRGGSDAIHHPGPSNLKKCSDKAATLAKPLAETQEPITSSSAAPMVLGEGYDLSSLLTFDPESIEPAASKASEESGPSATHGQLQHLKTLLSSSIETLVEDTEEVKSILEDIQPHLPVTLQVKLWPVVTLSAYRSRVTLAHMASPINFNQFLEKEKLKSNGSNFTDWFRHVRIFLNGGNLQYVLDAPLGDPPAETETDEVKNVYATRKTRYSQVQCAILCSLEADLQKRFEHHDPHELVNELKTIFETHAAVECYEASKHFFSCMMEEGSSVSEHMLAMTGHAKKLSDLGIVIPNRLGINRVLQSLPPSYKNFVMNYNMQNMNKELPELFAMLKSAEIEIKKEHQVLMVNKTTSFKKQGKSKGKNKKSGKKAATPPVKPKAGPKPDAECYYCKEKGHWKRNCSKYLADLKSGLVKKKKEGIYDIHVIDVYLTGSRTRTKE